jgi:hypothetical protein
MSLIKVKGSRSGEIYFVLGIIILYYTRKIVPYDYCLRTITYKSYENGEFFKLEMPSTIFLK